MRARLSGFIFALALAACTNASPPPTPAVDLAAEEAAIRAADSTWLAAAAARDAAKEASSFADDGLAFRGSDPLTGPASYQTFQAKYYADNPKSVSTWTTRFINVASSGDMAVQSGEYTETGAGPKGDATIKGNFLTYWKKVNGQWKVAADMSSPNTPQRP